MWVFTQTGMVSVVAHRDDADVMLVRARTRDHLESFLGAADAEITQMPSADYEFRTQISRGQFAELLAAQAMKVDYPNFKGRCDRLPDTKYASALHRIWSVVHDALATNKAG